MSAPSGKTLALWLSAGIAWLGFTALLGWLGLSSIVLLVLHVIAIAAILWRIARGTAVEQGAAFLLADDEEPIALAPYAGAAAWLSGFGTTGLVAAILMHGSDGFALMVGLIAGFAVASMIVTPALVRMQAASLLEWIASRFGARAAGIAKALCIVWGIAVLSVQLAFAALVGQAMFGLSPLLAVPVVAIVVLVAVSPGGMRTLLPAQSMLFFVVFIGIFAPALWLGVSQTGIPVPQLAPGALLHEIAVAEAQLGMTSPGDPVVAMMLGLTVLLGSLTLPHVLTGWSPERPAPAARSIAKRGVVLMAIVITAIPIFAIVVRAEYVWSALELGALPGAAPTPVAAIAEGVAIIDPPVWLLAALGSGALAAIVAASAGATFLAASAMGGDPARETAGGVLSQLRWAAALTVTLGAGVAILLPVDPVTAFLALLTIAASAFLAPLMLGLLWPGMTSTGALCGMIAGGGVCIALAVLEYTVAQGVALWGLAASAGAAAIVSLLWQDPKLSPPVKQE